MDMIEMGRLPWAGPPRLAVLSPDFPPFGTMPPYSMYHSYSITGPYRKTFHYEKRHEPLVSWNLSFHETRGSSSASKLSHCCSD